MAFDSVGNFEFKCRVEANDWGWSEGEAILRVRLTAGGEQVAEFSSQICSLLETDDLRDKEFLVSVMQIPNVEASVIVRYDNGFETPSFLARDMVFDDMTGIATHARLFGFTKWRPSVYAQLEYDKSHKRLRVNGGGYLELQAGLVFASSIAYAQFQVGKGKPVELFFVGHESTRKVPDHFKSVFQLDVARLHLIAQEVKYWYGLRVPWKRTLTRKAESRYRPLLLLLGAGLLIATACARANSWHIPISSAGRWPVDIAFFIAALGLSRWAYKLHNIPVAAGGLFASAGIWEWGTGQIIPHTRGPAIPIAAGVALAIYGTIPVVLGVPLFAIGIASCMFHLWATVNHGLDLIILRDLTISLALAVSGIVMCHRQSKLKRTGIFRRNG